MPSPFPGMDPYLEGEMWQEFHQTLAGEIRAALMPQLAPKYVALLAKRYVIDRSPLGVFAAPERTFYPDVHVVAPWRQSPTPQAVGRATVAPSTFTPPTVEVASPEAAPQLSVEVRDVAERKLVALIEILSPSNKNGDGAREYDERRIGLLQTQVHLLEMDLLRGGNRIALTAPVPDGAYCIYLSRVQARPFTDVWVIGLRDRLPVVPVPLLPPDPDVVLDVQAAVDACFALVGYERLLDYGAPPPPPPLGEADAAWAAERVRAAGQAG
jgi:hypothetical protein